MKPFKLATIPNSPLKILSESFLRLVFLARSVLTEFDTTVVSRHTMTQSTTMPFSPTNGSMDAWLKSNFAALPTKPH